jgi:hypothetical protein
MIYPWTMNLFSAPWSEYINDINRRKWVTFFQMEGIYYIPMSKFTIGILRNALLNFIDWSFL